MTHEQIRELRMELGRLSTSQKEILARAKDGWKAEDKAIFERQKARVEEVVGLISEGEALLKLDGEERGHRPDPQNPAKIGRDSDEYRAASFKYIRNGEASPELRALSIDGGGQTAYLVPETFEKGIREKMAKLSIMRTLATVNTSSAIGNIPVESGVGAAAWLDEVPASDITETDDTFTPAVIEAWASGKLVKISKDLLTDNDVNLEAYITRKAAQAIGELQEAAFISGNGTKKPTGLIVTAQTGKTAALTTAFTYAELLALWASLKSGYKGKWLMNKATMASVMGLADANGNLIWRPNQVLDGPLGFIHNEAAYVSDDMPNAGAGTTPIAYGDFSYYEIWDRQGVSMLRLNEVFALRRQVGFLFDARVDGKLLIPEAVKTLKMAAS